jgi:hypothetical protein
VSAATRVAGIRLCYLIPASPTDGFLGQIAMFRRSLDDLGGIYRDARLIAILGDATIQEIPARWRPWFVRIEVHHVPRESFLRHSYRAQAWGRWGLVPADCDVAIFADADAMPIRPIDDLLANLVDAPGIAGTIAHHPFPQHPGEDPDRTWDSLARELIGRELPREHAYTLAGGSDPAAPWPSPFYLNFGFVVVSRRVVELIAPTFLELAPRLETRLAAPDFSGQIALTLAAYAHDVRRHAVGLRYDFPNDRTAEARHSAELPDVRVIHYLRTHRFDRQRIFAAGAAFDDFLRLELVDSERVFQDRIRAITAGRYPFDRPLDDRSRIP